MVETTRLHRRLPETRPAGRRIAVDAGLGRAVEVFVPEGVRADARPGLLVHFHGAAWVPEGAAAARVAAGEPLVLAVVNLGAGSSRYEAPFRDPAALARLVAAVADSVGARSESPFSGVWLSGFSAGVGAIRGVLGTRAGRRAVDGALLLDGLHASYVPEGRVLHEGGRLDTTRLAGVLAFARDAVAGERTLVVTHSTIFPGTFASTTETADWLLDRLGLRRRPVLEWGPVGMQQISRAGAGRFALLGFAGNTAPDHVDHLHALGDFLATLRRVAAGPPAGAGLDR